MTPEQKVDLDNAARLQQMKINTRLTALQSALEIMKTPNYSYLVDVSDDADVSSRLERRGGEIDHVTLLAMAGDIEDYILDGLEDEAKEAIEAAKKPKPTILQVRP